LSEDEAVCSLAENGWFQAFGHQSVRENMEVLLKTVLEVLSRS